ncbi:hypothetical protein AB0F96_23945 [Streptomyces sp. NPDC023998]|uniref:hypothetical protein n=1 Tax=Streptomyces sp. NPDC023998 TaxID=3154597 RepID=UPI0033F750B4
MATANRDEAGVSHTPGWSAEEYAADAIDFAISAIEEAEYAALDAILARLDAVDAQSALG